MGKIEKAITWMENTARDDSHGYDQEDRWGEYNDYDCSSAVITAWENAGVPVKSKGGATYTGNMKQAFLANGFKDVTGSINLKTGSGLKRGDVLLNEVHHTAMYCGNGFEVEASINEYGTVTGGSSGDQTGKEFLIRSYRNYPWNCVLRYQESAQEKKEEPKNTAYPFTGRLRVPVYKYSSCKEEPYPLLDSIPYLHGGETIEVINTVPAADGTPFYYVKIMDSIFGFVEASMIEAFK